MMEELTSIESTTSAVNDEVALKLNERLAQMNLSANQPYMEGSSSFSSSPCTNIYPQHQHQLTHMTSCSETESDYNYNEISRLQLLEQEQEQLNSSLMALTTHFAQVQFRLKQIVSAPVESKEEMLKELEEFAFRGCPNLNVNLIESTAHEQIIEQQRIKQKNLIDQLKTQLEDLESYAYQSGDLEAPSSLVMEKQKIIIDQLKDKIDLPIDNLSKLSNEELKSVVDNAICQMVNPVKIKEQLVGQLKTQIEDLERFIDFLQGQASSPGPYVHKKGASAFPIFNQPSKSSDSTSEKTKLDAKKLETNQSSVELLKRILSVLQIYIVSQLGCGLNVYEKNTAKKSANHWGDLRAKLEMSVNKVLTIHRNLVVSSNIAKDKLNSTTVTTESDEEITNECPNELIRAVRKDFACSLRDLLQHGLIEINHHTAIMPFGCFSVRSKETMNQLHVWDLFIKYYEIKHGKEYTQSAASKLSQSFGLNMVAGRPITTKQCLLNAIDMVHRLHKNDTSNKDSCFKAFVCLALNEKKLVSYLKQILKTTLIIENYYQTWSYIKTTGFDDALKTLDQLKVLNSNLPVDKTTLRRKSNKELF